MKANDLVRPGAIFTSFYLKKGRVLWQKAHVNGDRKKICISRYENGRIIKAYINPHTEVRIK